ncbi:MAG: hypothetical protein ACI4WH_02405 [Oscillospiraceae bacterium]
MKVKYPLITIALGLIVTTSFYSPVEEIQAVEDTEYMNNPEYVAEHYDSENIGTLEERIELYDYLTSREYNNSIMEKTVDEKGNTTYTIPQDVEYYPKVVEKLDDGQTKEYIRYTDNEGNLVRLYSDGTTELLVGNKYNQYYLDQLQDYLVVYDEYNQENGTDWQIGFEIYTPSKAQHIVDSYKSMTVNEFKEYITPTFSN